MPKNGRKIIHLIVATRPNFVKIAPLYHALQEEPRFKTVIIHTGQHYDKNLSESFFSELGLPAPDVNMGVGSGTHAEQTGKIMIEYEKICLQTQPDWVVVVGDVNSTMATCVTAKKLCLPVVHLEAGLRSHDLSMPEEINRLITDAISDILWTPSSDATANLQREGVPSHKIKEIGNIMIDSYELQKKKIESCDILKKLHFSAEQYAVVTLHRPSNVDNAASLSMIIHELSRMSNLLPMLFPVHPRTKKQLIEFGLWEKISRNKNILACDPLTYIEFLSAVRLSKAVITDSGGIQEETTYLGIPCLTLRENTERPITITQGTNRLVSVTSLSSEFETAINKNGSSASSIPLWDGNTASRARNHLKELLKIS